MLTQRWLPVVLVAIIGTPLLGFTIDGDLSDWNIQPGDNNTTSSNVTALANVLGWQSEDQDDKAPESAFLGPNYGGQNYDAELMAVAVDGGRVCVAIVTGQRLDNGFASFAPGDLRLVVDGVTYGIELGGGAGGAGGAAIVTGASGSTYTLNGNGYTTGHAAAAAGQTVGSIWTNANWLNDPIAPHAPTQMQITGSSLKLGAADLVYTANTSTQQHAVYELSFDAQFIGLGKTASFHWRPACGNDELDVTATIPVPEPLTGGLLGVGVLLAMRRRR